MNHHNVSVWSHMSTLGNSTIKIQLSILV